MLPNLCEVALTYLDRVLGSNEIPAAETLSDEIARSISGGLKGEHHDEQGACCEEMASQLAAAVWTALTVEPKALLPFTLEFIPALYRHSIWQQPPPQEHHRYEAFPCHFVLDVLRGLNFRPMEERTQLIDVLTTRCDVPEGLKTSVLARYRVRRNQLCCKSLAPRAPHQCPGVSASLTILFRRALTIMACSGDSDGCMSAHLQQLQEELIKLLAESQMHLQLLCLLLQEALVSHHHFPESSGKNGRHPIDNLIGLSSLFPPAIRKLIAGGMAEYLPGMYSEAFTQPQPPPVAATTSAPQPSTVVAKNAAVAIAKAQAGDKKVKCVIVSLFSHGFLGVRETIALYFGSLFYGPHPSATPESTDASVQATMLDETLKRAAKYAADLDAFVRGTRTEAVIAANEVSLQGSRAAGSSSAAKKTSAVSGKPMAGDISMPSLHRVVHDVPRPTWSDLLAKAESRKIPWRIIPLSIFETLLSMGHVTAACRWMKGLEQLQGHDIGWIDIFSYAGSGVETTAAQMVIDCVTERLTAAEKTSRSSVAAALQQEFSVCAPLLEASFSHVCQNVPFHWMVLRCMHTAWKVSSLGKKTDDPLLLRLLGNVILPGFRLLAPCPPLYDALHHVLLLLSDEALMSPEKSPLILHAKVKRVPQEIILSKDLEAAFNSSLRRMTLDTVHLYRASNLRVMYSNPAFVCERLFQQAIGYENAQLAIHSQLLAEAPAPVLQVFLALGMKLMHQYATEQRDGCETRVSLIGTLICAVWRLNPCTFDGALVVREIERTLRRDARDSVVFAHEFLKAACLQLLGSVCEHEEQYSSAQLAALGLSGTVTRWFGRGAGSSFMGRWHPLFNNPEGLRAGRDALVEALNQPLQEQPQQTSLANREADLKPTAASVGGSILLHLARINAKVYDALADMPGTMETILGECAKQHNTATDLLQLLLPLITHLPSRSSLKRVALPALFLSVSTSSFLPGTRTSNNASGMEAAVPNSLVDWLSAFTAQNSDYLDVLLTGNSIDADDEERQQEIQRHRLEVQCCLASLRSYHVEYDGAVYQQAAQEISTMTTRLEEAAARHPLIYEPAIQGSLVWLAQARKDVESDKACHALIAKNMSPLVDAFLEQHVVPWIAEDPLDFIRVCVLPRTLLSLDDAVFFIALFKRLLSQPHSGKFITPQLRARVVDAMMSCIATVMALFVSFTDGESKRVGTLMAGFMQLLDQEAQFVRAHQAQLKKKNAVVLSTAATSTASDAADKKTPVPLASQLQAAWVKRNEMLAMHVTPSFVLDGDAFLAEGFYQILSSTSAPSFCFRNAFILLDRIKAHFPRTPEAATVMALAMRFHSDKNSAYFAAATAQMKLLAPLLSNSKGSEAPSFMAEKMQALHDDINASNHHNENRSAVAAAREEAERVAAELAAVEAQQVLEDDNKPSDDAEPDPAVDAAALDAPEGDEQQPNDTRDRSRSRSSSSASSVDQSGHNSRAPSAASCSSSIHAEGSDVEDAGTTTIENDTGCAADEEQLPTEASCSRKRARESSVSTVEEDRL